MLIVENVESQKFFYDKHDCRGAPDKLQDPVRFDTITTINRHVRLHVTPRFQSRRES